MQSVLEAIAGRNAAQQRRVVENRRGETIDVAEGSGLLVTGCRGCTIRAPGRSSGVTIERCDGGTTVEIGSVVASLEVIHCTDVRVSVERCYTITVDLSTNVSLDCKCQPSSEERNQQQQQQQHGEEEEKIARPEREDEAAAAAAKEASAIRLYTSCSEGVSITFEDVSPPPSSSSPTTGDDDKTKTVGDDRSTTADSADPAAGAGGARAGAGTAAAAAVTYHVPKDFRYEKGDGPRSVSRITIDRSTGGSSSGGDGSASSSGSRHGDNGVDCGTTTNHDGGVTGGTGRGCSGIRGGGGGGGGSTCKTLRCDQYGIPLEEVEAAKEGVPWSWEHGRMMDGV